MNLYNAYESVIGHGHDIIIVIFHLEKLILFLTNVPLCIFCCIFDITFLILNIFVRRRGNQTSTTCRSFNSNGWREFEVRFGEKIHKIVVVHRLNLVDIRLWIKISSSINLTDHTVQWNGNVKLWRRPDSQNFCINKTFPIGMCDSRTFVTTLFNKW